jgi:hypothetical protein
MSFGGYGRSPEEVQRHNGRAYEFKTIAERYENTIPLRGKRKAMNIRPHGERSRDWERIVKVNDNEYYLTNNAYRWFDTHGYTPCRAITFKRNDDGTEVLIVHTPRQYWGKDLEDRERLIPRQIGVPSTYYFYSYNLPHGMSMYKYHSKNYLAVTEGESENGRAFISYYTLEKGDVHLTRQVGDKYFKPLVVHREFHRSLDRSKTKAIRAELKEFTEYMRVITPLAQADRQSMYTSPIVWAHTESTEGMYVSGDITKECLGKGWRGLFTGEPTELWFKLVQYYKYKCHRSKWNPETRSYDEIEVTTQQMASRIAKEVYEYEKPLHEEPVELGVRTFDRYRSW